MSVDPEMMADRRRLRRKLSFWRVLGVLGLIAAVIAFGLTAAGRAPFGGARPQIARISVDGFIAGSQRMNDLFKRVAESGAVWGAVISPDRRSARRIDSDERLR